MSKVANPHDLLCKEMLGQVEQARDFLANYLPAEVVSALDLDTLEVVKDSFVDQELREHLSDIVYRIGCRDQGPEPSPAYVYLLFEHKSHPEPLVAFQLLRYMVRLWEKTLAGKKAKRLPPIIPLVLYHGRTRWKIPLTFQALLRSDPALSAFSPDFRYVLCDLTSASDDDLKGAVITRAFLFFLKNIFRPDLKERLEGFSQVLYDVLNQESGLKCLETLFRYLAHATDKITKEEFIEVLERTATLGGGSLMPTVAEQLIKEGMEKGLLAGRQEGKQEGKQEGRQEGMQSLKEVLAEALKVKFHAIPNSLNVTISGLNDLGVLKTLTKTALTANSLEEFSVALEKASKRS